MKLKSLGAVAALSLTLGGVGAAVATPAAAATTGTISVTPSDHLADGQEVVVTLTGFTAGDPVAVVECTLAAATSGSQADCDARSGHYAGGTVAADGTLTVDFVAETWNYTDANGGTCSPGGQCLIVASDLANGENNGTPVSFAAAPAVGANPDMGLKDGDVITGDLTGFTAGYTANQGNTLVVECDQQAIKYLNDPSGALNYCDTNTLQDIPVDANGNGTAPITVIAGASYSDNAGGKCDGNNPCFLAVASDISFTQVGYTTLTFDSSVTTPRAQTTTVVSAPKTGKAHHKVTVKAITSSAVARGNGFTGHVTFFDNGKKLGTVTEKASGTVSHAVKLVKGKNKVVAKYSGDSNHTASSGKAVIKAK